MSEGVWYINQYIDIYYYDCNVNKDSSSVDVHILTLITL